MAVAILRYQSVQATAGRLLAAMWVAESAAVSGRPAAYLVLWESHRGEQLWHR